MKLTELVPEAWKTPGYPDVEETEKGIMISSSMIIPAFLTIADTDGVNQSMKEYLCRGLGVFVSSDKLVVHYKADREPHSVVGWDKFTGKLYIEHG